jgi:glutamine amidotransferase
MPLADLLFAPPYGLVTQSWAPRDMRGGGTSNADGFGIGWYADDHVPLRYRRATPIWSDPDLPALAAATRSTAVLAAIRSATVGMPVSAEATAPFAEGPWLFSHNGVVAGWPGSVAQVAAGLPVIDLLTLPAPIDAALLWALVRHRLRGGSDAASAIIATVVEIAARAPTSRLNLLLTDGRQMVATTFGHALSIRTGSDSVLISSEPLDDGAGWQAVPDRSIVIATASTVEVHPLPHDPLPHDPLPHAPLTSDLLSSDLLPSETRMS